MIFHLSGVRFKQFSAWFYEKLLHFALYSPTRKQILFHTRIYRFELVQQSCTEWESVACPRWWMFGCIPDPQKTTSINTYYTNGRSPTGLYEYIQMAVKRWNCVSLVIIYQLSMITVIYKKNNCNRMRQKI